MKNKWAWGQFCPLIPVKDYIRLLNAAKKTRRFEEISYCVIHYSFDKRYANRAPKPKRINNFEPSSNSSSLWVRSLSSSAS